MSKCIYMDNAATTQVYPEVFDAMKPYFTEFYGNPSSIYSFAGNSKKAVEDARKTIADFLGARTEEIYFTGGGSESDNWALKATADAYANKGKHIITSKIEHHAILHTCEYIEKKGFGVLSSAYKLCDYRPLYGYIFQEYIEGYDYWGYCDIDTVLGDISSFLIRNNYTCYDRIGEKGHFTIYRNTKKCRELFTQYPYSFPKYFDFEFVKQTTYPCHFDESGMNVICNRSNCIKYLEKNFALQTTIVRELHLHTFGAKYPELFVFNKGHIYRYEKRNDSIMKEEYMYIHFQDRKKMPIHNGCEDCFLITHLGFVPFSEEKIEDYFLLYGGFDTKEEREGYLKDVISKNRINQKKKLKREFKTCGLRAFYNLYQRKKWIYFLKKNNMF